MADSMGIGINRTSTGSNALSKNKPEAAKARADASTIDEKYLLWFQYLV